MIPEGALAHPEISFSLQQNGMDVSSPSASLRQELWALWPQQRQLVCGEETSLMKNYGVHRKPEFAKDKRRTVLLDS